jgi:glycerate 2-kinase
MAEILEAGLEAANPYINTRKLLRVDENVLYVGGDPTFEPDGSPTVGPYAYDLDRVGRIYVFGAAKGVQYSAKAIEDVLGDRVTGGCVIAKRGDEKILERIEVVYGAHPAPDEGCSAGCRRILELCSDLRPEDLVFTVIGNGVSSLLTLPAPPVTIEDLHTVTRVLQIERGVPTGDLNFIRNSVDLLKGGRISRQIQPAQAVHIVMVDPDSYDNLMHRNLWLHTLPDSTTFEGAIAILRKWDAWDAIPCAVREYLSSPGPSRETVRAAEFQGWNARIFGAMPKEYGSIPAARKKAEELGFRTHLLSARLQAEAREAGHVVADIAASSENTGEPFEPPCALFSTGELIVTVGRENGVGGRNQEYALAAAQRIAGSANVVIGGVDTDGTDGPGSQYVDCELPCLTGGIVDGQTMAEAKARGVDVVAALKRHDTTPTLLALDSGILATQNISVGDLDVTLVLGRRAEPKG